jgi:predicted MPP superfamily phosphohydrolase
MRRIVLILLLFGPMAGTAAREELQPTTSAAPVKFAVIGDNGTGDQAEDDVGRQMAAARVAFPFEFVIMLGDNLYGRQDFSTKFEKPFAALISSGIQFYAALGNHDDPKNRSYGGWNMGGERYYTYARRNVRFFVLDSDIMEPKQVAWFEASLKSAREPWKICYFHHPLYSNGQTHGSSVELRVVLEPLLVANGVNVVFSAHDHVYERIKPQKGITYFVEGSGGRLRKGDVKPSATTAAYFDQDQTFMLVEIAGDTMTFQALSRTGRVVDSGVIARRAIEQVETS